MPTFNEDAPLEWTALEDFFLDISMTKSRKTPVPGAASWWFSMCRNYRGTNAPKAIIWGSLDTLNHISILLQNVILSIKCFVSTHSSFGLYHTFPCSSQLCKTEWSSLRYSVNMIMNMLMPLLSMTNLHSSIQNLNSVICKVITCIGNKPNVGIDINGTCLNSPVPVLWSESCRAELLPGPSVHLLLSIYLQLREDIVHAYQTPFNHGHFSLITIK